MTEQESGRETSSRERAFAQSRQFRERCLRNSLTAAGPERERDREREREKEVCEEEEEDVFAFGNTTVVDWGRIVPREGFFSPSQLFPLGFAAVRYEVDAELDSIVELLCEIDALVTVRDDDDNNSNINTNTSTSTNTDAKDKDVSSSTSSSADAEHTKTLLYSQARDRAALLSALTEEDKPLRHTHTRTRIEKAEPLFRVTARWYLVQEQRHVVRVYEGRNAPQVWQAVMMESVGVDEQRSSKTKKRLSVAAVKRKKTKREREMERDEDRDLSDEEHGEEDDDEEEEEEEHQHSDALHKKRARKRKRVRQIESKEDEEGEGEQDQEEDHEEGEESHEEKDGELEEDSLSTAAVLVARTAEEDAEEELSLRRQIFEQRRTFFRLMRQAQREGVKKPIRPRLALENMENFFDATLLKCIEGLENASRCAEYVPLAERSSPRLPPDFIQRDYTAMENRIKALLKLSRKLDLFEAQCKLHEQKQLKIEEQEMRKRNEFQAKEIRALVHNAQKIRAQRTKELEKATSALKAAKLKAAKKKREEVKALVDGFVDRQIVLHARKLSSSSEFLSSALLSAPRPVPRERAMCGVDEHFLSALQLWQFIACCGLNYNSNIYSSNRRTARAFACEDVFAALRALHPLRERLLRHGDNETGDFVLRETQREHTLSSRYHAERSFSVAVLNALGSEMLCNCKRLTDGLFGIETVDRSYTCTQSNTQSNTSSSSSSSSSAVVSLPVSALHWKELARNLLLLEILRSELDLSTETELSPWLRGKTSAGCDYLDKKLVKLARLRVDHYHKYAREVQESIAPLRAGVGVSLSAPVSVSRGGRVCDHAQAAKESLRGLRCVYNALSENLLGSEGVCESVYESVWAVSDVLRSAVRRFRSLSLSLSPQTHQQLQAIERGELSPQDSLSVLRPLCVSDESESCLRELGSVGVSVSVSVNDIVRETETVRLSEKEKTNTTSPRAFLDRCALVVQALLAHPTTASLFPAPAWIDLQELQSRCTETETETESVEMDVVSSAEEAHTDSHTTTESPKTSTARTATPPARLSLLEFYRSVQRVFASVAVKHLEGVSMSNYALNKLYCVFERLFLETVLCCDAPLYDPLACLCCRNTVSFSETPSTHVVCERCEGVFHAACVEPPLTLPVRGDWFCPYCVEQRGVSSTHPLCTARVTHPHKTNTPLVGEVVGIEPSPSRGELFFVVEFNHGLFRERWSSERVCAQLHSEQHADFLSPSALGLDLSDYDAACAAAKGYAGWGLGETEIAQALTEHTHLGTTQLHTSSHTAHQALSAKHEALRLLTEMSRGELCVCDAREWMSVLRSLLHFYQHTESLPDVSHTTQTAQTTSVTTSSAASESNNSSDVRAHPPHSSQPTPQTSPVRVSVSDGSSFRAGSPSFLSPTQEEMSMGDDQSQNTHTQSQSQSQSHTHADSLTQPQTAFDSSRELAQLASLRGEEDAIAAFETLWEMTLRYESEPLEEPPAVRNALGDFWLCCEKAMRGALSKPPESVSHTDAWCEAFVRKLEALFTQTLITQTETQSEKETLTAESESERDSLLNATPVCVVCRLGERELCHPLVDVPCETLSLCEDPLHTSHNAPTQPATSHKIHHCCLTLLTQCRELAQERAEKEEALSASETLRFVSTPHNVWVGRDRHGGLYWLLQDSQTVLVCDSPTPLALSSQHTHSHAPSSTPRYTYYREKSEILRLTQWLESAHPSERRLKRVLSLWTESALFHSVHAQRALREAVCVSESESVCGSSSELCGVSVSVSAVRDLLLDDALQRRASNRPFSVGDEVLILSSAEVKTKCWRARVVDVHTHRDTAESSTQDVHSHAFWYAVEVMDVPLTDVRYVSDCDVCLAESELATAVLTRVEIVCERGSVLNDAASKLLTTLNASRFVNERQRMGVHYLPRCSSSLITQHAETPTEVYTPHSFEPSDLSLLKDALLLVVSALPLGAIDENSEDKWARNFKTSWRATVSLASDAFMLMNCQLLLEYSIKPAWLKPSGLKAFSQLPSRGHALRNATIGSVAIRLWMLDQCVRYEKVIELKPAAESSSKSSKSKKK